MRLIKSSGRGEPVQSNAASSATPERAPRANAAIQAGWARAFVKAGVTTRAKAVTGDKGGKR